jgi:N-methylhydantoinase A
MAGRYYLGVDTGGTFTDFVLWHDQKIQIHKTLSTPQAPEQSILTGIKELGLEQLDASDQLFIVHGSTVATNAILEGKGVRTAFITNRGFADMLTIGRQVRSELYNLQPDPVSPPVSAELCLETGGRITATGEVLQPLSHDDIAALLKQISRLAPDAVAINLLFSYIDAQFELEVEKAIAGLDETIFISRSSTVLPEYKEYERGMTTWLNAYIGPLVEKYLTRLCRGVSNATVSVMQSSGGTIAADQAGAQAVHMVLSGPAGGLAAAHHLGQETNQTRLLTFDMGGTSTDVAMIDGDLQLTSEGRIGPYPVAIPMVDMHTIGAGGGSIASVDAGGLLKVGPESAGAEPGPACYGKGGQQATVTDANLVLGRLRADAFLGGAMSLDLEAARRVMKRLAEQLGLSIEKAALGIIQLANEHMAQALRVMSIQRGIDPRELSLMSFGGAGGLHVCALAEALGMQHAIVPVHAGVLSALGMLVAPRTRQLSHTVGLPFSQCKEREIQQRFRPLVKQGQQALVAEGVLPKHIQCEYSVDVRYLGQAYYLNVPWSTLQQTASAFHQLHEQRYGHALGGELELVNIRVALSSTTEKPSLGLEASAGDKAPVKFVTKKVALVGLDEPVPVIARETMQQSGDVLSGPILLTEKVSTTYVMPGWQARLDKLGNIQLRQE